MTSDFEKPIVSVDVVMVSLIKNKLKVLLLKRDKEPFDGKLSLVGGFVHTNEDKGLVDAATRTVMTKTGLSVSYLEQLETFGDAWRDRRGWSVAISYFATVSPEDVKDDSRYVWVDIEDAMKTPLAFDHNKMLEQAIKRIRGKSEYSTLAAYFLPKEFTLGELQQTYEFVIGKKLDKSAFRKYIKDFDMVIEVVGKMRHGSNRPAKLYCVKDALVYLNKQM